MTDETKRIGLADAISEIRSEISRAQQEGIGKDVRFTAKSIEVELSIDFGLNAKASGNTSGWIPFVNLSASAEASSKTLHKVRLSLEVDSSGDPSRSLITDRNGPKSIE